MNLSASLVDHEKNHSKCIAEQYLKIIGKNSPVICKTISEFGHLPLGQYLKSLDNDLRPNFQKPDDLADIVYNYADRFLGTSVASKASRDFYTNPVVLTANHHGVDYFAQSVQGSVLFALSKINGNAFRSTVPIFSCGNVPLDNLTYPMGLLLYHVNGDKSYALPRKLPVFSNSLRRAMVSVSSPFTNEMVNRAKNRVDKMVDENKIPSKLAFGLHKILNEDYSCSDVMKLSGYSQQSVVLNHRIWKRLFKDSAIAPKMVYLELEEIAHRLLISDMFNPDSLAWSVLFDADLRDKVIEELDGKKACWNVDHLVKRLEMAKIDATKKRTSNSSGTIFFWGINSKGRRIPLYLDTDGLGKSVLRGMDDRGKLYQIPFTFESIIVALNEKRLLPSIFTCFLVIAFARGVTCLGGYFQAEYLPEMQKGFVNALRRAKGYHEAATVVEKVNTNTYLSGMQTVMVRAKDNELIPAGPVEIIAGGGLTKRDLNKILSLTVKDAHLASLFETLPDVAPWAIETNKWQKDLAAECFELLDGKIVIK
jgi:hypothetical protein